MPDGEHLRLRQLDQPDGRAGDDRQRALASRPRAWRGRTGRAGRAGSRPTGASASGSPRRSPARGRAAPPRTPSSIRRSNSLAARVARERRARAVGEHDLELEHVVDRRAVDDRLAARGVVADHAAERRPVRGRRVRAEAEPVALRGAVQALLHDARLDAHAPRVASIAPIAFMWRERSSTSPRPPAVWPARLVPPPRGTIGTPSRAATPHRRRDVVRVARERDRERLDREHARVGRVQVPRVGVSAHLACQLPLQRGRELLHVHDTCPSR